jgi:DHA2 family multidrug resistance protein-like MFS transporter
MLAMSAILITVAMATLDIAVANTALPTIAADLNASAAASVWVVNAYQLAVVATLLPLAALGEIIGPRRVYLAGIVVFSVASVVCALAWSLPSLTLARVAQGLGASGVMSVNAALIRFIYPAHRLGRGIGLNAMVVAISTAIGPTVASGILAVANWPWLFAINLPFGLLAMAVGAKTLPRIVLTRGRFDGFGAALSAGLFGLLVIGVGAAAHADPPWQLALEFGGAALCLAFLLRHQRGRSAPMLPLDLFRRKMFALSSATAFASFGAQGLAFVALPFLFQTVLGHSQVETGLLMTPWPALTACAVPLAGRLADRHSAALLCGVGLIALAAGLASLVLLPAAPSALAIGWRMALCGAGFGFFQAPNQRALLSSAPPERSGGASGIVALSRLMGQAIGAALVAACFSIAGGGGPTLALALGAGFSAVAAAASFARIAVADTTRG